MKTCRVQKKMTDKCYPYAVIFQHLAGKNEVTQTTTHMHALTHSEEVIIRNSFNMLKGKSCTHTHKVAPVALASADHTYLSDDY